MASKFFAAAAFALAIGVAPVTAWAQDAGGAPQDLNDEEILLDPLLLKKKKRQQSQETVMPEDAPVLTDQNSDPTGPVIEEIEPLPRRKRQAGRIGPPEDAPGLEDPTGEVGEVEPVPRRKRQAGRIGPPVDAPGLEDPAGEVGEVEPVPRRKRQARRIGPPVDAPEFGGPSIVEIERSLEVRPRIRLAPEDRVTIREFKRRPDLRRAAPSIDIQSINFEFGSAQIPFSQYGKVENIAVALDRLLSRDQDTQILIEGHTDAVGSFGSNQRLSEQRAASLKRVLVREFGVPSYAMETVGFGEEYLLVPTEYEEWRNRRVTLRSIDDFIR